MATHPCAQLLSACTNIPNCGVDGEILSRFSIHIMAHRQQKAIHSIQGPLPPSPFPPEDQSVLGSGRPTQLPVIKVAKARLIDEYLSCGGLRRMLSKLGNNFPTRSAFGFFFLDLNLEVGLDYRNKWIVRKAAYNSLIDGTGVNTTTSN